MFDSGVVKRVDGIQRHCFLYENFEKDSNDADSMDSDLKMKVTKIDTERHWCEVQILIPHKCGKSAPALSRGKISNRRDEAFLLTKMKLTVHSDRDGEGIHELWNRNIAFVMHTAGPQ